MLSINKESMRQSETQTILEGIERTKEMTLASLVIGNIEGKRHYTETVLWDHDKPVYAVAIEVGANPEHIIS
jgi:hypothetical protein